MTKTIEMPEAAAHMYPSDLKKFKSAETLAQAYSVAVGNPDERSVPLFTLDDMVTYAALCVSAVMQPNVGAQRRAQARPLERLVGRRHGFSKCQLPPKVTGTLRLIYNFQDAHFE